MSTGIENHPTAAYDHGAAFARLLQVPTVAADLPKLLHVPVDTGPEVFAAFRDVLRELFPLVHEKLDLIYPGREAIDSGNFTQDGIDFLSPESGYDALLWHWKGKADDKPFVLLAHHDVVPGPALVKMSEEDTGGWTHPPFGGEIADGKIYGRGAMDNKNNLYCILRAVEELLAEDFVPAQDVWIGSSDSEEVGGNGAIYIRDYLTEHGVKPFLVVDEGGTVIDKLFPQMKKPFAMIGVVEKGSGIVKFTAKSHGGHTSAPPKNTPWERLARFIVDVHSHNYFPAAVDPLLVETIQSWGGGLSGLLAFAFKHIKLFKPLLPLVIPKIHPFGVALLHTNITFTMAEGAIVPNMIPAEAYIGANIRYAPWQGVEEVERILQKLCKKYDIEMETMMAYDATGYADREGEGYRFLTDTIKEVYPEIGIAPYMMIGGTDGRHFASICPASLRFSPIPLTAAQLSTMHGDDENLDVAALGEGVRFFRAFFRRLPEG